jgi:ABC-type xylose transport system permease subunit
MNQSFLHITDLPPADSLLLSTLLLTSGWVIARLDRAHVFSSIPAAHAHGSQWSIGDIAFATAMAACLSQAFVHSTWTLLLVSALTALAGGVVCSWLAYRWVWLDQYSLFSLLLAFLGLAAATIYVHRVAPVDATFWESVQWICMGPVNVIASQATSVLLVLALIRFESQYRYDSIERACV